MADFSNVFAAILRARHGLQSLKKHKSGKDRRRIMSGEKLNEAINLLAEYAADNLPAGYEVVLVFRSDECWLELQHDDDGSIDVYLDSQPHFVEACETATEYEKKRWGES